MRLFNDCIQVNVQRSLRPIVKLRKKDDYYKSIGIYNFNIRYSEPIDAYHNLVMLLNTKGFQP